jgi:cell volume regulation protein A
MDFLLTLFRDSISANIVYLVLPLILLSVVVSATYLDKRSIPVILVALFAGIFFGSDVLSLGYFNDMKMTNRLAELALVFILFHGGFRIKKESFKLVALPAMGLATWGVILTAVFTFICLHFILGWDKNISMLLSVIISSTDGAAIFSILRKRALDNKLKSTVEIESAANDPMAILLTVIVVQALSKGGDLNFGIFVGLFFWKFIAGPVFGIVVAKCVAWLINKLTPQESGYYYIILLCTSLFAFGLAETFNASGMLAAFAAGIILGNSQFVHKQGVYNFSSAFSTIANIMLFVLLGAQVEPSSWFKEGTYLSGSLYINGILFFLLLSFVGRPAAVFLGTLGMGIKLKKRLFIAWAGLRGAVPISLATYPVAAGIEGGMEMFNLVFFVVLLSIAIQGSLLGKVVKLLKLSVAARPDPPYSLEFYTKNDMEAGQKIAVFTVDLPDPEGGKGPFIRDLKLPEDTLLLMVARRQRVSNLFRKTQKMLTVLDERSKEHGEEAKELASKARDIILRMNEKRYLHKGEVESDVWQVLPPRGDTALCGWDQITVLSKVEDENKVREILLKSFETFKS